MQIKNKRTLLQVISQSNRHLTLYNIIRQINLFMNSQIAEIDPKKTLNRPQFDFPNRDSRDD